MSEYKCSKCEDTGLMMTTQSAEFTEGADVLCSACESWRFMNRLRDKEFDRRVMASTLSEARALIRERMEARMPKVTVRQEVNIIFADFSMAMAQHFITGEITRDEFIARIEAVFARARALGQPTRIESIGPVTKTVVLDEPPADWKPTPTAWVAHTDDGPKRVVRGEKVVLGEGDAKGRVVNAQIAYRVGDRVRSVELPPTVIPPSDDKHVTYRVTINTALMQAPVEWERVTSTPSDTLTIVPSNQSPEAHALMLWQEVEAERVYLDEAKDRYKRALADAMAALRPLTVEERKRVLDEAGVPEDERVEL